MRLNRVNVLTISLLVALTVNVVDSKPVSMYVRLEATSNYNHLYVNFYNGMFKILYDCMTDADHRQCSVKIEYEASGSPHAGGNYYKALYVTSLRAAHLDRSYFTCVYSQSTNTLMCTRYNTSQCGNECISFRLHSSSICDNKCVYLKKYQDEKLFYSASDNFKDCDPACTQTSTMHIPNVHSTEPSSNTRVTSRLPPDQTSEATTISLNAPNVHSTEPSSNTRVTSRLPSDQTSEATTNSSNIANSGTRNSPTDKQIPIIIGVVCSLLVVIIVVVVGIMYRRRKLIKNNAGNNGVSSPHTHANYNGGHVQPGIASTRYASTKPDLLTTLAHSSHAREKNEESEDGYYTIDKDHELKRYENALNTISSGSSLFHGGSALSSHSSQNAPGLSSPIFQIHEDCADNSQLAHTREGDYFVISDNDSHTDSEAVNEDRNLEGGYSLAKDVVIMVDVIDVSAPPRNVYTRFGDNATVRNNPYDMLLQPHQILNSRKTSIDATPIAGAVDDHRDTGVANATIELAETDSVSQASKTVPDMARYTDTAIVFPEYSKVNKTKT